MPKGLLEKGIRRYDNHVWVTHALPQPHRRSIRLKGYDYRQAGMYFFTICTKDRAYLFGEVVDGEMRLNEMGEIVRHCWLTIPEHFPHALLDEFMVMPNHVHGIILLTDPDVGRSKNVGATHASPLPTNVSSTQPRGPHRQSIASIVGSFKSAATKRINEHRNMPGFPVWQRNYYEHIIRNEESLTQIRQYILNNPGQWEFDRENPNAPLANSHSRLQKEEPWHV